MSDRSSRLSKLEEKRKKLEEMKAARAAKASAKPVAKAAENLDDYINELIGKEEVKEEAVAVEAVAVEEAAVPEVVKEVLVEEVVVIKEVIKEVSKEVVSYDKECQTEPPEDPDEEGEGYENDVAVAGTEEEGGGSPGKSSNNNHNSLPITQPEPPTEAIPPPEPLSESQVANLYETSSFQSFLETTSHQITRQLHANTVTSLFGSGYSSSNNSNSNSNNARNMTLTTVLSPHTHAGLSLSKPPTCLHQSNYNVEEIITAYDDPRAIYLWSVQQPNPTSVIKTPAVCTSLCNGEHPKVVIAGLETGDVVVYDTRENNSSGTSGMTTAGADVLPVQRTTYSGGNRHGCGVHFVGQQSVDSAVISLSSDGVINLWDWKNLSDPVSKINIGTTNHGGITMGKLEDDDSFYVGTENGSVLNVDVRKKKENVTVVRKRHSGPVTGFVVGKEKENNGGASVVSCGADWKVCWGEGEENSYQNMDMVPYTDVVTTGGGGARGAAGDAKYIWGCNVNGVVEVYDKDKEMAIVGTQENCGRWLQISKDGKRVIMDGAGGIVVGKIKEELV
jgi:hypothetical protein